MTDAHDRRGRTLERFDAEGLVSTDPYWHLDLLPGEAEVALPAADEIVLRALALLMVAGEATGMGNDLVDRMIDLYRPRFSPAEWQWFESPVRDPDDSARFGWRFESALPLLWAAGLGDVLPRPEGQAEPFEVVKLVIHDTRDQLLEKARVRPVAAILDAADLHHGYLRACRSARLDGTDPPAGLDDYVVLERNRAFRWLIGRPSLDWDEVVDAV